MPKKVRKAATESQPIGYICINSMMDKVIHRVIFKAKNRARERERNRNNPEINRARANAWRLMNPERKRKADAKNYDENKETRKEGMRVYGLAHRQELYAQRKLQRQTDTKFRLAEKLRGTLGHAIDKQLLRGDNAFSVELDHIFPLNRYDVIDVVQQMSVAHFTNMQPLKQPENRNKSDKLPTKAMAAKVDRDKWPPGITEDMLPDIYPGWATALRM